MRRHSAASAARAGVLAVIASAAVACTGTAKVATDVPIVRDSAATLQRDTLALFQTDSLHYSLTGDARGYRVDIGVVFTNRVARTVYFVNCGGATSVSLEKRVGTQWQTVWSPVLAACLSAPITVAPGASYSSTLSVFGARPGTNAAPQFTTTDLTGTYRLVWGDAVYDYHPSLPWGEPLSAELRASNSFALTAPPQ